MPILSAAWGSVSGAFLCCNGGYGGILGEKGCGWMNEINPMRDLPMGFGMALAQSEAAMLRYCRLSEAQKQDVLSKAHNVRSDQEMYNLVASLANGILQ